MCHVYIIGMCYFSVVDIFIVCSMSGCWAFPEVNSL